MKQLFKNCQSCGMPLKKDIPSGGTNSDGTKNHMYCSKCYQNGAFTAPNRTVEEMKTLVKEKLKEMGFPAFLAAIFTKGIPKLERWK